MSLPTVEERLLVSHEVDAVLGNTESRGFALSPLLSAQDAKTAQYLAAWLQEVAQGALRQHFRNGYETVLRALDDLVHYAVKLPTEDDNE